MTSLKTGLHQTPHGYFYLQSSTEKVIKQFDGNPYECLANPISLWILSLTLFNFMHVFIKGEIFLSQSEQPLKIKATN